MEHIGTIINEWREQPHPIWGKDSSEFGVHSIVKSITFPKRIWVKRHLSIVEPSTITQDLFELYDGTKTYKFRTLYEAQYYGDHLIK